MTGMRNMGDRMLIPLLLLMISCSEEHVGHQREPIRSLYCTLEPTDGASATVTVYYEDIDGAGEKFPIVIGGTLDANTVYKGTLQVSYDEVKNNAAVGHNGGNVTINQNPWRYQVFYNASNDLNIEVGYRDSDEYGNPVGLNTVLTTGASGSGELTLTVVYGLNKFADGVSSGNMTNVEGTTDLEVRFPITVVASEL